MEIVDDITVRSGLQKVVEECLKMKKKYANVKIVRPKMNTFPGDAENVN
jgi:hypothetical protein